MALHDQIGTVTHADLVDLREELVGREPCGDIGEAGLHAHAEQRHHPAIAPRRMFCELPVAEPRAGPVLQVGQVRRREVHRHVDVVASASNAPKKIGGLKRGSHALRMTSARIATASSVTDSRLLASTNAVDTAVGRKVADARSGRLGLGQMQVGDRDVVVRLAGCGDRNERRSDSTSTDHEYAHRLKLSTPPRRSRRGGNTSSERIHRRAAGTYDRRR